MAERIAEHRPIKDRASDLAFTQEYLLLHCPDKVWTILEGLPVKELEKLDLKMFAKK